MTIQINGSGTISGLSVGGLPDGCVDSDTLATSVPLGITEADQWRVTADFSSNADPITSNWERNDTSFDKLGTGMTQSSGVFTFPSTGIWYIQYQGRFESTGNSSYVGTYLNATTDSGSNYAEISQNLSSIDDGSGTWHGGTCGVGIFDVTNVSTHKVTLTVGMDSATCKGSSAIYQTGMTFIKLGAT